MSASAQSGGKLKTREKRSDALAIAKSETLIRKHVKESSVTVGTFTTGTQIFTIGAHIKGMLALEELKEISLV